MTDSIDPDRSTDVLARLRSATRALHAHIDGGLPLATKGATRADYAAHMRLLHAWLAQLAPAMAAYDDGPAQFGAAANQHSLDLLAQDVASAPPDAAGAAPARAPGAARISPAPAQLALPAFRWGMQYVIEGSYLGAGFLYQRYAPLFPDCPMFFFGHISTINKARWATFATRINAAVTAPPDMASAEQGAIHAFTCFMQLAPAAPGAVATGAAA